MKIFYHRENVLSILSIDKSIKSDIMAQREEIIW